MTFPLAGFPDDDVPRKLVRLQGIEPFPKRQTERRWVVVLKDAEGTESLHTVSAQFLLRLQLDTVWKGQICSLNQRKLPKTRILLTDPSPKFYWRSDEASECPVFLDRSLAGENRTSKYPSYEFVEGKVGSEEVIMCVSSSEYLRFFAGPSSTLSRHVFGFGERLQNGRLYRFAGPSFAEGVPERIEFLDKNIGELGQKLLFAMLTDVVGRKQLLSVSRSARAARARNAESNGSLKHIFPVFGLPYACDSELIVTGEYKTVERRYSAFSIFKKVFAVTSIVDTTHKAAELTLDVIYKTNSSKGDGTPRTVKKRPRSDNRIPQDVPEDANNDEELLAQMGVDLSNIYASLENIEINEKPEEKDMGSKFGALFNPDEKKNISGGSTQKGTDTGGDIAWVRGDEDEAPPTIKKSLLLDDENLDDLLMQAPDIVFAQSDVTNVSRVKLPKELGLLTACIFDAKKRLGGQYNAHFLGQTDQFSVPLIGLNRMSKIESVKSTGNPRRAVFGILASDTYKIIFADIERLREKEPIGIFSLLIPGDAPFGWSQASYILQCRLSPNRQAGSWPNAKTHGGGYVAKVQPHMLEWDDEELVPRKLKKFLEKLTDEVVYLKNFGT